MAEDFEATMPRDLRKVLLRGFMISVWVLEC
jgi:hypothetical protein